MTTSRTEWDVLMEIVSLMGNYLDGSAAAHGVAQIARLGPTIQQ